MSQTYEDQVRAQIEQYRDTENMHDLPAVFHLWSGDYVGPGLEQVFGIADIGEFYVEAFVHAARNNPDPPVFLSLGCGDGAVEIGIARSLRQRGLTRFRFVCYDLSDLLLDRFRAALPADLAPSFELVAGDLNAHVFAARFDAVMANHSLHHIVDLEGVYRTTFDCLTDDGIFVTADMIGRNGHMRWPETRLFVDFFWPLLTLRQRRNVLLRRQEGRFQDHDCSGEGFEGVRAQEVLPLILKQGFHPWRFFGFGGMVDVFVDRCFGPGFDVANPDDAFLARRIGFLNEVLLDAGFIKPTMMFAWFTKAKPDAAIHYRDRTAAASVRRLDAEPDWLAATTADFARFPVHPDYVFREGARPVAVPAVAPAAAVGDAQAQDAAWAAAHTAAGLVDTLRDAQALHAAAQATIEQQQATIERQDARIRAMERSSSWELTGPLRVLAQVVRRFGGR